MSLSDPCFSRSLLQGSRNYYIEQSDESQRNIVTELQNRNNQAMANLLRQEKEEQE